MLGNRVKRLFNNCCPVLGMQHYDVVVEFFERDICGIFGRKRVLFEALKSFVDYVIVLTS